MSGNTSRFPQLLVSMPRNNGERFAKLMAEQCKSWRGTCRIEHRGTGYYCSVCDAMVGSNDVTSELYIDANAIELWCFCPRCGSVVSADD